MSDPAQADSPPANGYAALVNALREAVLRLKEWGPAPADAFWINEVAAPLISKYSKPHTTTPAKLYPCGKCGLLRTTEEGGKTFTVCDECWDSKPCNTDSSDRAK